MKKKSIMGLEYKWETLIVYLVPLLGLIFSFMKDKKVDKDVKLHYNQAGAICIINIAVGIISSSVTLVGFGRLYSIIYIVSLLLFIVSIIAVVKAFNDEAYEIPVISDIAKAIWKE